MTLAPVFCAPCTCCPFASSATTEEGAQLAAWDHHAATHLGRYHVEGLPNAADSGTLSRIPLPDDDKLAI